MLLGCLPFYPLMRFLLLIRMVAILRHLQRYGSHPILDRLVERKAENALRYVGFLIVFVLTLGSIMVLQFESASPDANILTGAQALWWSVVTVATVGYGDFYPVTNNGRLVGIAIMIVGVGMFGVLSSYLAKTFLSPTKQESADKDLQERERLMAAIHQETELIRQEMSAIREELADVRHLLGSQDNRES